MGEPMLRVHFRSRSTVSAGQLIMFVRAGRRLMSLIQQRIIFGIARVLTGGRMLRVHFQSRSTVSAGQSTIFARPGRQLTLLTLQPIIFGTVPAPMAEQMI